MNPGRWFKLGSSTCVRQNRSAVRLQWTIPWIVPGCVCARSWLAFFDPVSYTTAQSFVLINVLPRPLYAQLNPNSQRYNFLHAIYPNSMSVTQVQCVPGSSPVSEPPPCLRDRHHPIDLQVIPGKRPQLQKNGELSICQNLIYRLVVASAHSFF